MAVFLLGMAMKIAPEKRDLQELLYRIFLPVKSHLSLMKQAGRDLTQQFLSAGSYVGRLSLMGL